MGVYIAGPMRGHYLYNFPAFDTAAEYLLDEGFEPINPADIDRANGYDPTTLPDDHDWDFVPAGFDLSETIGRDIDALRRCSSIYMLRGWEQSTGARAEHALAEWLGLNIAYAVPPAKSLLPNDSAARKCIPIYSGLLKYFPLACAEVARLSYEANEKHNPGEPMHWSREKSSDHLDCAARHLLEAGVIDSDGFSHTAHLAWRALAELQLELE